MKQIYKLISIFMILILISTVVVTAKNFVTIIEPVSSDNISNVAPRIINIGDIATPTSIDIEKTNINNTNTIYDRNDLAISDKNLVQPKTSICKALDNCNLQYHTGGGGDAYWFVDSKYYKYGGSSARSGAIADNQESWIETTVNGPGEGYFYMSVSSEKNHDYLEFYLDGVLKYRMSGDEKWGVQVGVDVDAGTHTLKWRYYKDGSNSIGADAGYIDKFRFGEFKLLSPSGGENWKSGSTQIVRWSNSGNLGKKVNVDLYKGKDVRPIKNIASNVDINKEIYMWKMEKNIPSGNDYYLRINAIFDDKEVLRFTDQNKNYFTISGPQIQTGITVKSPNGGEKWKSGTSKTVKWTNINFKTKVNIDLYQDDSLVKRIASNVNGGSYNWKVGKWSGDRFKAVITTIDGQHTDTSNGYFSMS